MKKVVAYVQGGIGNQLFIFLAGHSVAVRNNAKLIVDMSLHRVTGVVHPGGLGELEILVNGKLAEYEVRKIVKPLSMIKLERIVYKLLNSSAFTRKFLTQYRSKVTGFDPNVDHLSPSIGLIGYFQSYKYFHPEESSAAAIEISLSRPSAWFTETRTHIAQNKRSVAIHMRRGDYALNMETLGLLTDEYFLGVLSEIQETNSIDRVFIFSDSPESARNLQDKITTLPSEVITPPDEEHPAEILLLQQLCHFKIISNSTFSWWSAYLGSNPERIYAPTPWYRNQNEPAFLIPDSWQRRNSKWIT